MFKNNYNTDQYGQANKIICPETDRDNKIIRTQHNQNSELYI